MNATVSRISFGSVSGIDKLVDVIRTAREIPEVVRQKLLAVINTRNPETISRALGPLGFTPTDAQRIFYYPDGKLREANTLRKYKAKLFNYRKHYIQPSKPTSPVEYLTSPDGVIIGAFGLSLPDAPYPQTFLLEPNSEYYLAGDEVMVITNIRDAVAVLSNHGVESDSIKALLRYIRPTIAYVIDWGQQLIYGFPPLRVIKVDQIKNAIVTALQKLDTLRQPYPSGFLMIDGEPSDLLVNFMKSPESIHVLNQVYLSSLADGNFYDRYGLTNACFTQRLTLSMTDDGQITNIDKPEILRSVLSCDKPFTIIPIGLETSTQKHQTILIFKNQRNTGSLFDPSASTNSGAYIKNVTNYLQDAIEKSRLLRLTITGKYSLKQLLTVPDASLIEYFKISPIPATWRDDLFFTLAASNALINDVDGYIIPRTRIISNLDVGCPVITHPLQADPNDIYCLAWSAYFSLLYLLNPNVSGSKILELLYSLGDGLSAVIPRFLISIVGEHKIELILDMERGQSRASMSAEGFINAVRLISTRDNE